MKMLHRSTSAVAKLILYFSAFVCSTSCKVGDIYFGDYYSYGEQKISIAADSTFLYSAPGLMGTPGTLTGTWTRVDRKLLLQAKASDVRKLEPSVAIDTTEAAQSKLVLAPEVGVNVSVEVLVNGAKVGEISSSDSSFVFEGELNQLVLKAYATGMYAALFRNDTLYADAIDFSGHKEPVLATVAVKVALRDFYKVPVENSYLQIKNREKLYWEQKHAFFYFEE